MLAFLTKLKLADHAEKFNSFEDLLSKRTWELKEMGLTVKQRKTMFRLLDVYRTNIRVRKANAFIYANAHRLSPPDLQAELYRIMYGHIYSHLDRVDANKKIESEWRTRTESFHDTYRLTHNNTRGLREPEIVEMQKMEALIIADDLKELKERMAAEKKEQDDKYAAERASMLERAAAEKSAAEKIQAVSEEQIIDAQATKIAEPAPEANNETPKEETTKEEKKE